MNTHATASFQNPQVDNTVLSGLVDSFMRLIAKPEPASTYSTGDTLSALQRAFDGFKRPEKSLLVIRVENEGAEVDVSGIKENASAFLARQSYIVQQLENTCGLNTFAAPIGDGEYAVLLLGVEQCTDLIPRMENVVSHMATGRFRANGESLKCTVGVARCPLDAEDLSNLIRMASTAASELGGGGPQYQFISRRHRQN